MKRCAASNIKALTPCSRIECGTGARSGPPGDGINPAVLRGRLAGGVPERGKYERNQINWSPNDNMILFSYNLIYLKHKETVAFG